MNVLLCAINSKYIHSSLAVWCLAGGIKEFAPEINVKVMEATINEKFDEIYAKILSEKFDIIGFSTYIWNLELVLKISEKLKSETNKTIVLGGPEVSYNSKELIRKYSFVDFILCGEGERSFAFLCKKAPLNEIDGLCYRMGGEIYENKSKILLENPPSPYIPEYFDSLNGRIAYIETSRGCPFNCAFCLSGRCEGVRFFDIEQTKKNILKLANSGASTIKFIDRTFNADRKRAIEIFKFIIGNYGKKVPPSVCFHFEIEGELIDDDTINVLKDAPEGLFQFEIGIQSFNSKTLESIERKSNLDKLVEKIKQIISLGNIHVHVDLIIGLPYEDMKSFANSFNKAYELNAHMLQIGFLKVLHGANIEKMKDKYKYVYSDRPPYEILSTQWLTFAEIESLHLLEDVFEKMYNSNRFERTCDYLVGITKNPFDLFMILGKLWNENGKPNSLDDFSSFLFNSAIEYFGADRNLIRDAMALDRLSSNHNASLPEFLKIHSPKIKRLLLELDKDPKTKRLKNIKRSATLLASENKFVYVDYINQNKLKKHYKICEKFIEIDEK
ncbi:MAG: DUF4080 domain-containing protein [Clostridia bacterium]|nr:DUF4080 domain-containing protein [Clostridia bacterium]